MALAHRALVPLDVNQRTDCFVHDRKTGLTTCISVDSAGNQGSHNPVLSANGKVVVFESYATDLTAVAGIGNVAVYVRDLKSGVTTLGSITVAGAQADEDCTKTSLSKTGRWITFGSFSAELVAADDNGVYDAFLRDRKD